MHHLFLSVFPDSDIRFCVLSSLDERFDAHLAQAENLSALFVALNDEVDWKYCLHQKFFHEDYFSVFYLGFVFSQAQKQHNCFVLLSINRSLRFVSLQFVLLADLAVWIQHTSCHHWGKRLFRYMSYYVIMYIYGQFSKLTVYSTSLDLTRPNRSTFYMILISAIVQFRIKNYRWIQTLTTHSYRVSLDVK